MEYPSLKTKYQRKDTLSFFNAWEVVKYRQVMRNAE
jgi:hypothetical protein